jgi:hypothetical protein
MMRWAGHAWERTEQCTRFWRENPNERNHLEDQGIDGRMGSEYILGETGWGAWSGFKWLRLGTGGTAVNAVMNLRVLVPWS